MLGWRLWSLLERSLLCKSRCKRSLHLDLKVRPLIMPIHCIDAKCKFNILQNQPKVALHNLAECKMQDFSKMENKWCSQNGKASCGIRAHNRGVAQWPHATKMAKTKLPFYHGSRHNWVSRSKVFVEHFSNLKYLDPLRKSFVKIGTMQKKISMAPAQGWRTQIEKCEQFFAPPPWQRLCSRPLFKLFESPPAAIMTWTHRLWSNVVSVFISVTIEMSLIGNLFVTADCSQGRLHAGLAQSTSCVALAWRPAMSNTPIVCNMFVRARKSNRLLAAHTHLDDKKRALLLWQHKQNQACRRPCSRSITRVALIIQE